MAVAPDKAFALARALRELRETEWPDAELTQALLATALSGTSRVAPATLSSWESQTNPKTPSAARLGAYARFFCTRRSLEGGPHLIPVKDLDDDERARFQELEDELLSFIRVEEERRDTFTFTGGPVVIICPDTPKDSRGPLAVEQTPNYSRMQQFADLDALIEIFGHIRARNPNLTVRYLLASEITAADLQEHLVVIGGVGWNKVARRVLAALTDLPISQRELSELKSGDVFIVGSGNEAQKFYPQWDGSGPTRELIEDVAMVARVPNPYNSERSLTIFNGIHSRGVVAAVQTMINPSVILQNERYLAERFPGGKFALLLRVPVYGAETLAPDISDSRMRLYEWPTQPEVESA